MAEMVEGINTQLVSAITEDRKALGVRADVVPPRCFGEPFRFRHVPQARNLSPLLSDSSTLEQRSSAAHPLRRRRGLACQGLGAGDFVQWRYLDVVGAGV